MNGYPRYITLFFLILLISARCFSQANRAADSIAALYDKIQKAKQRNDNRGALSIYFGNSFTPIASTNEDFEKVTTFIKEGIAFARSVNEPEYVVTGYLQLAGIYRRHSEYDKALRHARLALEQVEKLESDSLKTITFIELGDCFRAKSELVEASKSFTTAYDLALEAGYDKLESNISLRLSRLYSAAGDTDEAKRHIYKSIEINKKTREWEGLLEDYMQLAQITDNDRYIDTVFSLAEKHGLQNKTLNAKVILGNIYGFVHKDYKKALNYVEAEPELKATILSYGLANYHWFVGQLFRVAKMPDSALHYLKLAEPSLVHDLGVSWAKNIYMDLADCYAMKKNWAKAIFYYEIRMRYNEEEPDLANMKEVSGALSNLYNQSGDYKKAYQYKLLSEETADSLDKAARQKELVLLDLGRERKKHDEELRLAAERLHKKHNLQYMGITIAICVILLVFLLLGMFPVSKLLIKIFGFIYFICVFEFIILLIEHSVLHPITHGDPLKLWLLKIVLIAMLVPIQTFIEHNMIKFLQSRKLHEARMRWLARFREAKAAFFARFRAKKKKPVPAPVTDNNPDPGTPPV